MPKQRITTLQFIANARVVHGNKYDYSLVEYINTYTKVKILCRDHGEFFTRPNDHCSSKNGCPKCANKHVTTPEFIEKANKIHNNVYDYSKAVYVNSDTKLIIICKNHDEFLTAPREHLFKKNGCPKCAIESHTTTVHQFIERADQIHKKIYQYTNVAYKNLHSKVAVTCLTHGDFLVTPSNHVVNKSGCPLCAVERSKLTSKGGYNDEYFILYPDQTDIPAKLYAMEFGRGIDKFIKVGITTRQVKTRFQSHPYNTYNINPILIKETTLFDAYTKEQLILQSCKNNKYFPNEEFAGYTECLKNHPEVIQQIKNILEIK